MIDKPIVILWCVSCKGKVLAEELHGHLECSYCGYVLVQRYRTSK